MAKKFIENARVADLQPLGAANFLLTLEAPLISRAATAGQFIEIAVPSCSVLWRRPFSINDVSTENGLVEILFQILGRGTRALAEVKRGDSLSVIGPLGNGFRIESTVRRALIVAGGLGIAPFPFLLKRLGEASIPSVVLYGVGQSDQLCCVDRLRERAEVYLCTLDGSAGEHGTVVDLLEKYLQENSPLPGLHLFTCGPTPMMRKVQTIAEKYQLPGQASLETVMACGFGACVGCAVPMRHPQQGVQEYYLACKDGPVFNLEEIIIHD